MSGIDQFSTFQGNHKLHTRCNYCQARMSGTRDQVGEWIGHHKCQLKTNESGWPELDAEKISHPTNNGQLLQELIATQVAVKQLNETQLIMVKLLEKLADRNNLEEPKFPDFSSYTSQEGHYGTE